MTMTTSTITTNTLAASTSTTCSPACVLHHGRYIWADPAQRHLLVLAIYDDGSSGVYGPTFRGTDLTVRFETTGGRRWLQVASTAAVALFGRLARYGYPRPYIITPQVLGDLDGRSTAGWTWMVGDPARDFARAPLPAALAHLAAAEAPRRARAMEAV